MRILVTWGSKRGGTEGIARMLGDELQRGGVDVDLLAPEASMPGLLVPQSKVVRDPAPDLGRALLDPVVAEVVERLLRRCRVADAAFDLLDLDLLAA